LLGRLCTAWTIPPDSFPLIFRKKC
jgi:hypothetical protein